PAGLGDELHPQRVTVAFRLAAADLDLNPREVAVRFGRPNAQDRADRHWLIHENSQTAAGAVKHPALDRLHRCVVVADDDRDRAALASGSGPLRREFVLAGRRGHGRCLRRRRWAWWAGNLLGDSRSRCWRRCRRSKWAGTLLGGSRGRGWRWRRRWSG